MIGRRGLSQNAWASVHQAVEQYMRAHLGQAVHGGQVAHDRKVLLHVCGDGRAGGRTGVRGSQRSIATGGKVCEPWCGSGQGHAGPWGAPVPSTSSITSRLKVANSCLGRCCRKLNAGCRSSAKLCDRWWFSCAWGEWGAGGGGLKELRYATQHCPPPLLTFPRFNHPWAACNINRSPWGSGRCCERQGQKGRSVSTGRGWRLDCSGG